MFATALCESITMGAAGGCGQMSQMSGHANAVHGMYNEVFVSQL
jgi:hypothetical protein